MPKRYEGQMLRKLKETDFITSISLSNRVRMDAMHAHVGLNPPPDFEIPLHFSLRRAVGTDTRASAIIF